LAKGVLGGRDRKAERALGEFLDILEKLARGGNPSRVRRVGISKVVVSAGILLPIWLVSRFSGFELPHFEALVGSVVVFVGAFGLVGLAELALGIPFGELAGRWDSLQGWQRGILGTLILIAAFVAFALVLFWVPIW
jgi:hypothetical protein